MILQSCKNYKWCLKRIYLIFSLTIFYLIKHNLGLGFTAYILFLAEKNFT